MTDEPGRLSPFKLIPEFSPELPIDPEVDTSLDQLLETEAIDAIDDGMDIVERQEDRIATNLLESYKELFTPVEAQKIVERHRKLLSQTGIHECWAKRGRRRPRIKIRDPDSRGKTRGKRKYFDLITIAIIAKPLYLADDGERANQGPATTICRNKYCFNPTHI